MTSARQARGIDPATALTSAAHYCRTKLMDIMFSQELARRLEGTGVTANCCDPGFNTTGLGRELPFAGLLEKALHALRITDGYFSVKDAAPLGCPEPGRGVVVQRELWEATEELLS